MKKGPSYKRDNLEQPLKYAERAMAFEKARDYAKAAASLRLAVFSYEKIGDGRRADLCKKRIDLYYAPIIKEGLKRRDLQREADKAKLLELLKKKPSKS